MKEKDLRKELIYLLIIFSLAFLLRFAYCALFREQVLAIEANIFGDTQEYMNLAKNILAGEGLQGSAHRPPVYPIFLASVYSLFGEGYWPLRIVQIFLSSFTCILIYFLGKSIFTRRVGIIAASIASIYPFSIFSTAFTLTETLFILLLVATIFSLSRSIHPTPQEATPMSIEMKPWSGQKDNLLAAGILLGLTILCRPASIFFLFFLFWGLILLPIWPKHKLKNIAIIFILVILTIAPWSIRNYFCFHKFVPLTTQGGHGFWEGNNPQATGGPCQYFPEIPEGLSVVEKDRYLTKATLKVIRENPGRFLKLLGIKFVRIWNIVPNYKGFSSLKYNLVSIVSYGPLLLTAIWGIFLSRKYWRKVFLLYIVMLSFTTVHMLFVGSVRYRVPVTMLMTIFSAYTLNKLWENVSNRLKLLHP